MDKLIIKGPSKLSGTVHVSRAKNAYLPILAAVLLNEKPVHLENLPDLRDIKTMVKLLKNLGVKVKTRGKTTTFDSSNIESFEATYDLVKTMRASILVLGPLLARFGKAKVSLPGGCAIGTRPIDLHLDNMKKMGAEFDLTAGYVDAKVSKLKANKIILAFPSVGATENLIMTSIFTEGTTVIENVALEPEIDDLIDFLTKMGADIEGIGTSTLSITGVKKLKEVTHEAIGDRIEAGTYLMAALATKSEITISGIKTSHLESVLETLKDMGANLEVGEDFIKVLPSDFTCAKIETTPYPGFPTDLQAQMMSFTTQINCSSIITENIFENRFMHVPELIRMGAKIDLKGNTAFITGETKLVGAPVMCTDLRASAALIIAALTAEGETVIQRVYHLDRGYEKIDAKLIELGVDIKRVK